MQLLRCSVVTQFVSALKCNRKTLDISKESSPIDIHPVQIPKRFIADLSRNYDLMDVIAEILWPRVCVELGHEWFVRVPQTQEQGLLQHISLVGYRRADWNYALDLVLGVDLRELVRLDMIKSIKCCKFRNGFWSAIAA